MQDAQYEMWGERVMKNVAQLELSSCVLIHKFQSSQLGF